MKKLSLSICLIFFIIFISIGAFTQEQPAPEDNYGIIIPSLPPIPQEEPQQKPIPQINLDIPKLPVDVSQDIRPLSDGLMSAPFRGGAVTSKEPSLITMGGFSMVQNMRGDHPGFFKRPGQIKLHSTVDGTNEVLSAFQFKKSKVDEYHFFAQMSDGDILDATNQPPTVTAGAFGGQVLDMSSAGQKPASWAVINDTLIFSSGVSQHQIYGGASNYVEACIVYPGPGLTPRIPTEGKDYSIEVSDGQSTVVDFSNISASSGNSCVFLYTPVPVTGFYFGVLNTNSNASVSGVSYWNGTWAVVSNLADNTVIGGVAFAKIGTYVFDTQTDVIPKYQYGRSGFWYQIGFTAALDASAGVTEITYQAPFQSVVNVWDGTPVAAVEVYVEASVTAFYRYGSDAVSIENLSGASRVYIASADPIEGIYVDPGNTPNLTGVSISYLRYWDGDSWNNLTSLHDGSSGVSNPGWITFERQATVQPKQLFTSKYQAYWYEITYNTKGFTADTVVSFKVMPYFTIGDFGYVGASSEVWKDRTVYSFDRYPQYLYVSSALRPMVLNGFDYAILKAGDGRWNKIVAMKKFHNELMVWQEEKGVGGGCLTLFEGYSPDTFGRLVLSPAIGTFSPKSVVVLDGIKTKEGVKTLAFWISNKGIFVSDGRTVSPIDDDIKNYFDPTKSECIRRGYEDKMWIAYDSAYNILRVGLVSGGSATKPNVFPVYDLTDGVWYFDSLAQPLSFVAETQAISGVTDIIQVGGGTADGTLYHLNFGFNDVSTAIDAFATIELNKGGNVLWLNEMILQAKAMTGNSGITPYLNGVVQTAITKSNTAESAGERHRRHRFKVNLTDENISLKIGNSSVDESIYLENLGLRIFQYENR